VLHTAQFSSSIIKGRWIYTAGVTERGRDRQKEEFIIWKESDWAGGLSGLTEGRVRRDVAASYKYTNGWTPGKDQNELIWGI